MTLKMGKLSTKLIILQEIACGKIIFPEFNFPAREGTREKEREKRGEREGEKDGERKRGHIEALGPWRFRHGDPGLRG